MSGGPYVFMDDRRFEFNEDGTVNYNVDTRMPATFSRLHHDGFLTGVDTEIAMRIIRTVWANQRRAASKGRLIRTHCCRCTCKCPAAWGAPNEKDEHNSQNAITHKHRHKAKLIDRTTQVCVYTKTDAAVQVNITRHISVEKLLFGTKRDSGSRDRELVFSESNLSLLRRFLRHSGDSRVLAKFDSDERFQSKILYKLNPLVHVERCPKIGELTLKSFEAKSPLQPLLDAPIDSIDSNQSRAREEPLSSTSWSQQRKEKERSDEAEAPPKRKQSPSSDRRDVTEPKVFRRNEKSSTSSSRQSNAREYTPLEDAAIVRWVCMGGASRERKVNGNQIWKQLQEEYSVLSGQERSWHSLRNRYLRYILPSLQRRGDVAAAVASRLRAHAAMGQAKAAPDPVEERPRVISAWSLRPRTPRTSHSPAYQQNLRSRRPLYNPRSVGD